MSKLKKKRDQTKAPKGRVGTRVLLFGELGEDGQSPEPSALGHDRRDDESCVQSTEATNKLKQRLSLAPVKHTYGTRKPKKQPVLAPPVTIEEESENETKPDKKPKSRLKTKPKAKKKKTQKKKNKEMEESQEPSDVRRFNEQIAGLEGFELHVSQSQPYEKWCPLDKEVSANKSEQLQNDAVPLATGLLERLSIEQTEPTEPAEPLLVQIDTEKDLTSPNASPPFPSTSLAPVSPIEIKTEESLLSPPVPSPSFMCESLSQESVVPSNVQNGVKGVHLVSQTAAPTSTPLLLRNLNCPRVDLSRIATVTPAKCANFWQNNLESFLNSPSVVPLIGDSIATKERQAAVRRLSLLWMNDVQQQPTVKKLELESCIEEQSGDDWEYLSAQEDNTSAIPYVHNGDISNVDSNNLSVCTDLSQDLFAASDSAGPDSVDASVCSVQPSASRMSMSDPGESPYFLRGHPCERNPMDDLLFVCGQQLLFTWTDVFSNETLKSCKKIGEGVFGEVFRMIVNSDGDVGVFKIIPIEGNDLVNDEKQKTFEEIMPEILIAREMSALSDTAHACCTPNFVPVHNVSLVQGSYPPVLLDAWDAYDESKGSENDRPDMFNDEQLFVIFHFGDGGCDLESFQFKSVSEAESVIIQLVWALAVAEEVLEFEHRDLHIGNILLKRTQCTQVSYRSSGGDVEVTLDNGGIQVFIIDFTLSRLKKEGCTIFNELGTDEALFNGPKNEYQFDIYRMMRTENGNDWKSFHPRSNVFWLHYVCRKLIEVKKYNGRKLTERKAKDLRRLESELCDNGDSGFATCQAVLGFSEALWTLLDQHLIDQRTLEK